MRFFATLIALAAIALTTAVTPAIAAEPECRRGTCVEVGGGALMASYFEEHGVSASASNSAAEPQPYHWRLRTQCQLADPVLGGCQPGQIVCAQAPDRVVVYYVVESQRLVLPGHPAVDGLTPDANLLEGAGFGQWQFVFRGCVDVTDLNPPPSPGEV